MQGVWRTNSVTLVARVLAVAGGAYLILLLVFAIFFRPETRADWKDINILVAQIVGGSLVITGLYLTWRTLQLNQEGQITQRFSSAVQQLGSKHTEVRLGGIYALERIARDSPRDHWTIMEILTAYTRHRSPRTRSRPDALATIVPREEAKDMLRLPVDIQTILTVLGNRTLEFEPTEGPLINLGDVDLRNAMFGQDHFERATFILSDLENAWFNQTYLSHALFMGAMLESATFLACDISTVLFEASDLRQATFQGLIIGGGTLLGNADLRGATFQDVIIEDADFSNAHLEGTKFIKCNLHGAQGLTGEQLALSLADIESLNSLPDYIERIRPPGANPVMS